MHAKPGVFGGQTMCFKAKVIMSRRDGTPIGTFYSYDKCPSIAYHVERACLLHADQQNAVCRPVELSLFERCPIEPHDRIQFEFIREKNDEDTS
jgi:hypothetical protein